MSKIASDFPSLNERNVLREACAHDECEGGQTMRMEERLAALEYENRKLRADNEKLHAILKQMQITLNRLISCYIVEARR